MTKYFSCHDIARNLTCHTFQSIKTIGLISREEIVMKPLALTEQIDNKIFLS